ncbi:PREDICTED: cAMP-dependent protein kinase catalytic subunit-like, partial [Rhagoletis zephyria]|uniref:cAMP-dependent protein kinase catalytic subunit-like n=1 Tax=Rhagoletis zephyria TaxID=28612 RepID=UPI000811637D
MLALQQLTTMTAACLLCSILFAVWPKVILCRPSQDYSTDGTELVVVKEIVRCTRQGLHELCQNATTTNEDEEQRTALNADNESVMDVVDDLILLEKKPKSTQQPQPQPQQQQQQQQQLHQHQRKQTHPYGTYQQQSELMTSAAAREDTLVSA